MKKLCEDMIKTGDIILSTTTGTDRDNRKLCRMRHLSLGELKAGLGHEAARALRNISWHSSRRSRASSVPQ
jgi:hypothetical protein